MSFFPFVAINFNPRSYKRSDNRAGNGTNAPEHYFNPRSYKRSDMSDRGNRRNWMISIHAPTRGATH